MDFWQLYGSVVLFIWAFMTSLWIASLALRNSSIVDPMWGTGLVLSNWFSFLITPHGYPARKLLISILVTIWGLRLTIHLLRRNWGKGEDYRYREWREQAGARWWWFSYFKVFMIQGAVMCVLAAPFLAVHHSPSPAALTPIDLLAVPLWGLGFFFESVGDWQLSRFLANPANKGKLLRTGLWRYTRHPNYFGESIMWWGHYLVALSVPNGVFAIVSPALITFLLLRVSGVTLLEKTMRETTPGYREYVESTSAFVPWFPRKRPE
jgi:steroid 5-alpha reductase family enzyme